MSETSPFNYDKITNLMVFGDSLSADGTDFNTMKIADEAYGREKNWPIQFMKQHNMNLFNFAIPGAVVDPDIVPRKAFKLTYRDQCRLFMDKVAKGKPFSKGVTGENSLFSFWYGTNDLMNFNRTAIPPNMINRTIETLNDVFMTSIEDFYNTGARNFLFLNVQSLDDIPQYINEPKPKYDFEVNHYNQYFKEKCLEFYEYHKDCNIFIYNIKDEIRYIMDHYKDYNFHGEKDHFKGRKNIKGAENKLTEDFLWEDILHTTNKTNKIFYKDMDEFLKANSHPSNKKRSENDEDISSGLLSSLPSYIITLTILLSLIFLL
ncbi:hypothetical protein BCR32DRAFT_326169 [Anaeromyces robustus]|uniref:SGNH hydrolase n=1 Tax=Anaeromyces robustus TaxID=1754192 RepID=A0A1Y1XDU7_9FUNG|nr:hypothetical protein BCR32DRAFT_326169 [Anaeromyces robustus]|eukprot:ORX83938.1 hypothetical protein BCR32DRAFT_326169 [Anaeromyces robustus]